MRAMALAVGVAMATLVGCASIPRDPDGTLDRIRATDVVRVGASPSEGRVAIDGDRVSGPEAELASRFAQSLGAQVQWSPGGEEELVGAMEEGELDLLIGGLTAKSAWASKVGLTRPYEETTEDGKTVGHVLAVPLGENAMMLELERFMDRARA